MKNEFVFLLLGQSPVSGRVVLIFSLGIWNGKKDYCLILISVVIFKSSKFHWDNSTRFCQKII